MAKPLRKSSSCPRGAVVCVCPGCTGSDLPLGPKAPAAGVLTDASKARCHGCGGIGFPHTMCGWCGTSPSGERRKPVVVVSEFCQRRDAVREKARRAVEDGRRRDAGMSP
jgi:hypothetical protein